MERDVSTPLSSLMLSSQVFRPHYPAGCSSRFGNDCLSVVTGNKDNIFVVPQHRVPLNFSIRRRAASGSNLLAYPYDEQSKTFFPSNDRIKHSDHSVKINKVFKVAARADNLSELGSHGFVSEGNVNMYWSPITEIDNQVAGKLVIPNFLNMKASTRASQGSLVISPSKHSSSLGSLTDGLRIQPSFPPTIILNSQNNSSNVVNEMLETGHYDYLKAPQRAYVLQREKCISVTYKEQLRSRPDKLSSTAALNRMVNSESANGVAGDVESRLRLNDVSRDRDRLFDKSKKNVSGPKAEESRENVTDEGSEEFISRAATPDDDISIRDGDSQAWDDDEEAFDDEECVTDADDVLIEADCDEDDEDLTSYRSKDSFRCYEVPFHETLSQRIASYLFSQGNMLKIAPSVPKPPFLPLQKFSGEGPTSRSVGRVTSAAPDLVRREAAAVDSNGGLSTLKKQLSPAPLSRVRVAQQEQQRRLRDSIGIDKNRPVTGCSVVYNGSGHGTQATPTVLRNRLAALPKRSITRPPTAANAQIRATNDHQRQANGDAAPFHRRSTNKVGATSSDCKTLQALQPSMFSNVPPTLVFGGEDHTVMLLPKETKNLLRWRTSTITPNILKKILSRSNFKLTSKDDVWVGCWAKHMKQDMFKALREFQKFNHFPGSFQIGRKDRLWRNLSAMQARFGKREFSFFPQTYVLPADYKMLKRVMEESEKRQRWILKPPASARGNGIRCVCSIKQVPKKRPVIVQRYIHQPYLINESKFDIRLYVYVASYDPLRAYIFNDGLARFASSKYSASLRDLPNKFMHLTNYSINKHNSEYQSNGDQDACTGHKWSLHALWNHLASPPSVEEIAANGNIPRKPVDVGQLWTQIKDIAVKALMAAEQHVVSAVKMNVVNRYAVHELFGFDILLDRDLRPWLLEVNISPSLHSDSPLDCQVKGEMLKDLLNLAGYRLPDPTSLRSSASNGDLNGDATSQPSQQSEHGALSAQSAQSRVSPFFDPRLVASSLSVDERSKHSYFTQNWRNDSAMRALLDTITPDDLRVLVEFEDERSRCGGFEPIFPTPHTHSYLKMMEPPRYYNLLLDAWLRNYGDDVDADGFPINRHEKGVELLDSLCRRGLHQENPTSDWRHIWRPPALGAPSYRPTTNSANNIASSSCSNNGNSNVASSNSPTTANGTSNNSNNNGRANLAPMHSLSTGSLPNCN